MLQVPQLGSLNFKMYCYATAFDTKMGFLPRDSPYFSLLDPKLALIWALPKNVGEFLKFDVDLHLWADIQKCITRKGGFCQKIGLHQWKAGLLGFNR